MDFFIYLKLFISSLLPIAISVVFYLARKYTRFGKLKNAAQQIVIGVVFGAAAIFGTEFGVDIGGATANVRDAAPLCAGLIFGWPAGVIAGVIGGVERWFATYWGAGGYSQIACSVATVFAGVYAAFLRKFMFDDKRPTWGIGFAAGVVTETIHMLILFLTHLDDSKRAIEIVMICTIPMALFNGMAVMLSLLLLRLIGRSRKGKLQYKKITQRIQAWLLVCVVLAFSATTFFVYIFENNSSLKQTDTILTLSIDEVKLDILDESDKNLLNITHLIASEITVDGVTDYAALAEKYKVYEIYVVNHDGLVVGSNNAETVGVFDMNSGEQSGEFMVLTDKTSGVTEYVQKYQPMSYDENEYRKFAGVSTTDGGFIQAAYDGKSFHEAVTQIMTDFTKNRLIGENGYILIIDDQMQIVSDHFNADGTPAGTDVGFFKDRFASLTADRRFEAEVNGEKCFCMYGQSEGYYIVSVYPQVDALLTRNTAVYINTYMEIIVFAILFAMIYYLIKKLVVDNIRSVNNSLSKIIGGDLDVRINIRSSDEFASLSEDINETVSTLKHFIEEAASRIDQELEYAKNIQHAVLPTVFPAFPALTTFDVYATMDTAKEVGGDFYDFYMVSSSQLAFLIADVSGKGIPAAMFMMTAKTTIKNLAQTGMPAEEVLSLANEKLCEGNDTNMFVTVWMGILNIHTGHVDFVNAGHNPPLICRNDGGYDYLRTRPGFVLAGMEGVRYKTGSFDLLPGEKVFLYTDGITEANDPDNAMYGEKRLAAYLNAHRNESYAALLQGLREDIASFANGADQSDDITMLIMEYKGSEDPAKTRTNEKVFPADKAALTEALSFVEDELNATDCPMKLIMSTVVAVEEIFVNIAQYAYKGTKGDVKITLSFDENKRSMTMVFRDSGVPFDPLAKPDPDVTLSAEEREIGGLGIFMVKKTMTDVRYEYKDGENVLTLIRDYQ